MNVHLDSSSTTNNNNNNNNKTMSLLWARRDILGIEFECGNAPVHCFKCVEMGLGPLATPNDFNQAVILNNILLWSACPERFYCPTALDPPVPCPSTMPWSPVGSASIANCTCARGSYLLQTQNSRTCMPCANRNGCPTGQFMSGWTQ
jgi:hypothetical protein